eukprot:8429081-Ditylum_brightwellii.AAC.1
MNKILHQKKLVMMQKLKGGKATQRKPIEEKEIPTPPSTKGLVTSVQTPLCTIKFCAEYEPSTKGFKGKTF